MRELRFRHRRLGAVLAALRQLVEHQAVQTGRQSQSCRTGFDLRLGWLHHSHRGTVDHQRREYCLETRSDERAVALVDADRLVLRDTDRFVARNVRRERL